MSKKLGAVFIDIFLEVSLYCLTISPWCIIIVRSWASEDFVEITHKLTDLNFHFWARSSTAFNDFKLKPVKYITFHPLIFIFSRFSKTELPETLKIYCLTLYWVLHSRAQNELKNSFLEGHPSLFISPHLLIVSQ